MVDDSRRERKVVVKWTCLPACWLGIFCCSALPLRAAEGHLRQYTLARTKDVPFARDGMYYKEFPVMFDWLHNAEGLSVFCMQGLSDPRDPALLRRARRYAGFYLNEDPGAPNYDLK